MVSLLFTKPALFRFEVDLEVHSARGHPHLFFFTHTHTHSHTHTHAHTLTQMHARTHTHTHAHTHTFFLHADSVFVTPQHSQAFSLAAVSQGRTGPVYRVSHQPIEPPHLWQLHTVHVIPSVPAVACRSRGLIQERIVDLYTGDHCHGQGHRDPWFTWTQNPLTCTETQRLMTFTGMQHPLTCAGKQRSLCEVPSGRSTMWWCSIWQGG